MSTTLTATKLDSFHRTKEETKFTKKGTIMFHYALEGDKAELDKYEEGRGAFFKTVEEGPHKGKAMWFTSQILPEVVQVRVNAEGNLNVHETLEEATAKAQAAKDAIVADKQMEKKAALAAKHGLVVQL